MSPSPILQTNVLFSGYVIQFLFPAPFYHTNHVRLTMTNRTNERAYNLQLSIGYMPFSFISRLEA